MRVAIFPRIALAETRRAAGGSALRSATGGHRDCAPSRMIGVLCLGTVLTVASHPGHAQRMEPRNYANLPVGTSFLINGYSRSRGGISFGPALPASNPDLVVDTLSIGYAHVFDFAGRAARFDLVIPTSSLSGSATYQGATVSREVDGLGDLTVRGSVNLMGGPALRLPQFRTYRQDLIVGGSLEIVAPTGQYDETKLVNLGANRWSIKPELGASKAFGALTLEFKSSVTWFTDNHDFLGGNSLAQKPLLATQANAIYDLGPGVWMSFDATYHTGGRTSLNGVSNRDLQENWRLGATLVLPIATRHALKLYASSGVSARTGNSYDLYGIAWQYRWGEGR